MSTSTPSASDRDLRPENRPFRPHGAAERLLYCRDSEVVLSGPAGTGKSRACLEKLHLCALKYPAARFLIVRKTRTSLTESALVTYEDRVLPEGSPILEGASRPMRRAYSYPNGSTVVIGGLDKATKIMSTEFDMIYVQEAIELSENDWESLTTRLRSGVMPYQQLIADTNPDAPTHWLKLRADAGRTTMLESRHEDNPTVTPEYLSKLDALTGVRYHRLRHGRWVAAEGAVYEWDRAIHLVDRREVPEGWVRFRSIDFGYTNPFVCQWWAMDHDGRIWLYREIYRTRRLVADHAAEILRLSADEPIAFTVADHDAEDRATLHAAGIPTVAARKRVKQGIEAVQVRLRPAGDGWPRLMLMRDSLVERDEALANAKLPWCTEQEFDGYVYPKGQHGRPVKEDPVKLHDHGMDAMRYAVMAADRRIEAPETAEAIEARAAVEARAAEAAQGQWLDPANEALWESF